MKSHPRRSALRAPVFPFSPSRRRFGVLGGGGLLALSGCGGGDVAPPPGATPDTLPVIPTQPQPPGLQQLSLLAGGLGGAGRLEGRGTLARLVSPADVVVAPSGAVYFTITPAGSPKWVAKASPEGDVRFLAAPPGLRALSMNDQGAVYAFDSAVIRKLVEAPTPVFVPVAGLETTPGLQDGAGAQARLLSPSFPVAGAGGHIYFFDSWVLRRLSADGTVVTIAGRNVVVAPGELTPPPVDGQGAAATFASPTGMVRMPDGNLLVLDNSRWRRVTPDGWVTTLPGVVRASVGHLVAADATGVFTTSGQSVIRLGINGESTLLAGNGTTAGYVEGAGAQARFAFGDFQPPVFGRLPDGDLVVPDALNAVIRRIEVGAGKTSPWLGAAPQPGSADGTGAAARLQPQAAAAFDAAGNLYLVANGTAVGYANFDLRKITPAGVVTTQRSALETNIAIAFDAAGNLFGVYGFGIIRIAPGGQGALFAGVVNAHFLAVPEHVDGQGWETARFVSPRALAFDTVGNLLVGDGPNGTFGRTIRKITPSGLVSTIASLPVPPPPFDLWRNYWYPTGLGADAAGNVYVLDTAFNVIRRYGPQGGDHVELIALDPSVSRLCGMAVLPDGTVYYAQQAAVSGTSVPPTVRKLVAGGPPQVVAGGDTENHLGVRTGDLPGSLNTITGLIASPDGALFVLSENSVLKIGLA